MGAEFYGGPCMCGGCARCQRDQGVALAEGIREDARAVALGTSPHVRFECPDCGSTFTARTAGEDGRCARCTVSR